MWHCQSFGIGHMVYQQHALDRILIAFQNTVLKASSTEIRAFFLLVYWFELTLQDKDESDLKCMALSEFWYRTYGIPTTELLLLLIGF